MEKVLKAIDGRFGNKVLKPQYRVYWRLFTYGTLATVNELIEHFNKS